MDIGQTTERPRQVLGLSDEINAELTLLKTALLDSFESLPQTDLPKPTEGRAPHANVLDEVMCNQDESLERIHWLRDFITSAVIKKIHR